MGLKTKIHLASNLSFGTDVITEVIDLIAKRGSGKTYTATKLAEGILTVGAQVVVVDPVGNWYGLRLEADGKAEGGLDITVLGGRNGDIPLEHTAGKLIAKTIVETGISAILDVSTLSKPKQRRFITEFSEALLEFRKKDPAAMHIFWEEAYRFMPQKMSKGSKNEMLEATEELVTMGRNYAVSPDLFA
jgi:DNA helicase HerA-like ATPase